METLHLDHGVTVLHDSAPIPGIGVLPVNAILLRTQQPVLVDTGMPASREAILGALTELIDPADLRWIWLTHPDRDHTGALDEVLAIAPQARLVTTFLRAGILALEYDIAPERLYLLNLGQTLDMGDRQLTAFRPPMYDSPRRPASWTARPVWCSPLTASARLSPLRSWPQPPMSRPFRMLISQARAPTRSGTFEVRQPGQPKAVWEVTDWHHGRSFTWVSTSPGIRSTAVHTVHDDGDGDGSRLDLSLEWSGPLAWALELLIGRKARAMVETEAETSRDSPSRADRAITRYGAQYAPTSPSSASPRATWRTRRRTPTTTS